jgi:hypothetical protein
MLGEVSGGWRLTACACALERRRRTVQRKSVFVPADLAFRETRPGKLPPPAMGLGEDPMAGPVLARVRRRDPTSRERGRRVRHLPACGYHMNKVKRMMRQAAIRTTCGWSNGSFSCMSLQRSELRVAGVMALFLACRSNRAIDAVPGPGRAMHPFYSMMDNLSTIFRRFLRLTTK